MVVFVNLSVAHIFFSFLSAVPDAGVWDFDSHFLVEEALKGVGGVNPAVGVEDVLGDVLGVDAVYGVPDVLARGHYEAERDQQHHGNGVVKPEHRRVDVYIVHLYEIL